MLVFFPQLKYTFEYITKNDICSSIVKALHTQENTCNEQNGLTYIASVCAQTYAACAIRKFQSLYIKISIRIEKFLLCFAHHDSKLFAPQNAILHRSIALALSLLWHANLLLFPCYLYLALTISLTSSSSQRFVCLVHCHSTVNSM